MAKKKGTRSIPVQIALASLGELFCMLALTAISAALVRAGVISQGSMEMAALFASALAVFFGSLMAAGRFSQKKLPLTMAACGGYLAALLLGNLLFTEGAPHGVLLVAGPALGAALLAALLAGRKPKPKYRR